MSKKLLLFLIVLCYYSHSFSQEKNVIITGKIKDSIGVVKNANIINLKTNQGTFSNDNGMFRIIVSLGDSLRISSVQHITKILVVKKTDLKSKKININLVSNIYQLEEFELKKHDLTGRLDLDLKKAPVHKKDSMLNRLMDFSEIDMTIVEPDDYIDKRVRPQLNQTDPTMNFFGAGTSVSMPFKYSERLWALRRDLAYKKSFPYKILLELGEKFFFDELKIPVEKYFHFLEYCNPLGIENLHKRGNLLEVIKILRQESNSYHKIIKNE